MRWIFERLRSTWMHAWSGKDDQPCKALCCCFSIGPRNIKSEFIPTKDRDGSRMINSGVIFKERAGLPPPPHHHHQTSLTTNKSSVFTEGPQLYKGSGAIFQRTLFHKEAGHKCRQPASRGIGSRQGRPRVPALRPGARAAQATAVIASRFVFVFAPLLCFFSPARLK